MDALFKNVQGKGDVMGRQSRGEHQAVLYRHTVVLVCMEDKGGGRMGPHMQLAVEQLPGFGLVPAGRQAGDTAVVVHPGGSDDGIPQNQGVGPILLPCNPGQPLDFRPVPMDAQRGGQVSPGREAADGDLVGDNPPFICMAADEGHGPGQIHQGLGKSSLLPKGVDKQESVEPGSQVRKGHGVGFPVRISAVTAAGADHHCRPLLPNGQFSLRFPEIAGQGYPAVAGQIKFFCTHIFNHPS